MSSINLSTTDPVNTSHVPLIGDSREQDGLLNPDPEQPAQHVDSKVTRGFYLYSWAVEARSALLCPQLPLS
jgi:hypothetical protein